MIGHILQSLFVLDITIYILAVLAGLGFEPGREKEIMEQIQGFTILVGFFLVAGLVINFIWS